MFRIVPALFAVLILVGCASRTVKICGDQYDVPQLAELIFEGDAQCHLEDLSEAIDEACEDQSGKAVGKTSYLVQAVDKTCIAQDRRPLAYVKIDQDERRVFTGYVWR